MADPQLTGVIRAQVIQHSATGEAEDVWVNTWCFAVAPPASANEDDEQTVADRLQEFYEDPTPSHSTSVIAYNSRSVTNPVEIKTYQLEDAPPREPTVFEFDQSISTVTSLPAEVAMTLSFYADRNLPRNRGRVYIGPLNTGVLDFQDDRVVVSSEARTTLAEAATRLAAYSTGPRWCVLSQADASAKLVTAGWVDDAFDIIRKRGEDAVDRTLWP